MSLSLRPYICEFAKPTWVKTYGKIAKTKPIYNIIDINNTFFVGFKGQAGLPGQIGVDGNPGAPGQKGEKVSTVTVQLRSQINPELLFFFTVI